MAEDRAVSVTIPPPVQGLNTRDPISEMQPTYAVDCENFYSDGYSVDLRKGTSVFASSIEESLTDLFSYNFQDSKYLIALSTDTGTGNVKMVRISSAGTKSDITGAVTNLENYMSAVNFRERIFFSNGTTLLPQTSDVYVYTGTGNIAAAAFTGPSGDDKALMQITSYKSRLYFCGYKTLSIWYGGIDAATGTLTEFPLQSIFMLGGQLMYCGSTGRNAQIDQDYFCAISDRGEVLVYQGDSPSSSTWALVGRYFIPEPLSYKSFFYWGVNLVILTTQGVIMLSDVMAGNGEMVFLSDPINSAWTDAVGTPTQTVASSGFWYPAGNKLLFNVVNNDTFVRTLFVMSTINRSWWKWTGGVKSDHYANLNNSLYGFNNSGTSGGYVFQADTGDSDDDPDSATVPNRTIKLRSAFNYFGDRAHVKTFTSARPVIYQSEGLDLTMGADVDFANDTATSTEQDLSDTSYKIYQPVMGLTGVGKCASIRIDGTVTEKRMSLQAIEVFYKQGGLV